MGCPRLCLGLSLAFFLTSVPSTASLAARDSIGVATPGVEQMVFCAAIKDRAPVGIADTLPADISRVYCFTRIVGAQETTSVAHIWYYGDKKMAEVRLPVRSSNWRTWSSKRVMPDWKGGWRVEILTPDSAVIATKGFYLK
ncbi:MAG TPA: DUF2914 domain-containing protein [Firmicutes bacterium]|nr:DUF2914 domain-containing protein [Bacillota bacterium]